MQEVGVRIRKVLMRFPARIATSIAISTLLLGQPAVAFDTPLSDQAVREAYFLGQRHDETMANLLNKYTKFLPPPKAGPDIASITFLTPFALLVQQSGSVDILGTVLVARDRQGGAYGVF